MIRIFSVVSESCDKSGTRKFKVFDLLKRHERFVPTGKVSKSFWPFSKSIRTFLAILKPVEDATSMIRKTRNSERYYNRSPWQKINCQRNRPKWQRWLFSWTAIFNIVSNVKSVTTCVFNDYRIFTILLLFFIYLRDKYAISLKFKILHDCIL